MSQQAPRYVDVPVVHATRHDLAPYGILIDPAVAPSGNLTIPFYEGSVEEGMNLPFVYDGKAVLRTARIHPRSGEVTWLERHMKMTQLFVGLGDAAFAMVLGKPNHAQGADVPVLEDLITFVLPPGHGVMIHIGTWHDFPMAIDRPVTVLTANSEEVVAALARQEVPAEMDEGDVYKLDVTKRTGAIVRVRLS